MQGWGVSRKGIFLFVILNSGAKRNVIQNPLHRDGILLLPRLGKCWDGECPVRAFFRHSGWRRCVNECEPNPKGILPMRHSGLRAGVPFTGTIKNHSAPCNPSIYATLNRVQSDKRSVIPGYDPESPASREGINKTCSVPLNSFYYAIPGRSPE